MAQMIDAITIDEDRIYKGAARLVQRVSTNFPAKLEDVMNPAVPAAGVAYALASGWIDIGATTDDGVKLARSVKLTDGIKIDQRNVNIRKGDPDTWEMGLEATLLETSLENFQIAWAAGTLATLAVSGTRVAQHSLSLDGPASLTERQFAFAQEDPTTGKLRVFAFRKAMPVVDSDTTAKSGDPSTLPLKMDLQTDTNIAVGAGQFGLIFEED